MKRFITHSVLLAITAIAFSGCLKDKGFGDYEYGINDPDTQPPGVGFPRGSNAKTTVGLEAASASTQVVGGVVYVNLESGKPASSDIQVTLVLNDMLRRSYNATLPAGVDTILPLSSSLYNVQLNLVIPAGQRNVQVPINVLNTISLDPNHTYGIGFTISNVSGGLKIASNLKNLLVEFSVKNKYDGRYRITGTFQDVSAAGAAFGNSYPLEWELQTAGATKCIVVDNENLGFPGYAFNSGGVGPVNTFYGSYGLVITFDPATDNVSSIWNYYGDPTMAATSGGTPSAGTGPPLYASSNTRRAVLDPSGINKYTAATKQVDIKYWMVQPSVVAAPPNIRSYFNELWKYVGPR